MKKDAGFERERSLQKERYFNDHYFNKHQLFSLSEQIHLVYQYAKLFDSPAILEVGKGNAFVSDFFKKAKFDYKTFDINKNLEPDIIGNILELNDSVSFSPDIILCAEVLEHMEFKYFEASLKQLCLVTNKYVIITLPDFKRYFGVYIKGRFPKFRAFNKSLYIKTTNGKILPEEHFWEIDYNEETGRKKIEFIIEKYFHIIENDAFPMTPHHNFYVLEKNILKSKP